MLGASYGTKEMIVMLRNYILALGRIPSQSEVRNEPSLPADDTYLRFYHDWESVIEEAGFTMSWCSIQMRNKLINDLWYKYIELDFRPPTPQDIQNDPKMEKVFVYTRVFGDLSYAWKTSGIWEHYCQRQREKIAKIILDLYKELGRVPKIRDPGMPNSKVINRVFGSYAEALESIGLEPNYQFYTKEKLVQQLRRKFRELGRSPTAKEIDEAPEMASMQTFRRVFGSHRKALKAAKLPQALVGGKNTEQELIDQLRELYIKLGRTPTIKDVKSEPGIASVYTFKRTFGSFKEALISAGISTDRSRVKYGRNDLIRQLQRKAEELGRAPLQKEIDSDPEMPSVHAYRSEFGCYNAAVMAAGLKTNRKRRYTDEELLNDLEKKYQSMNYLKTGKRPTDREINADPDMASTRAYNEHFGGVNKARELVEERILTKYSKL